MSTVFRLGSGAGAETGHGGRRQDRGRGPAGHGAAAGRRADPGRHHADVDGRLHHPALPGQPGRSGRLRRRPRRSANARNWFPRSFFSVRPELGRYSEPILREVSFA